VTPVEEATARAAAAHRGGRFRTDDAVDGESVRGLERAHGGFCFRPVDPVDGDAERALDEFDLAARAFGADRDRVFGGRRRFGAGRGGGLAARW